MDNRYDSILRFINPLKNDGLGEWIVNHKNDGTTEHLIQFPFVDYSQCVRGFEEAVYRFYDDNPDYGLSSY